jgi:hypothetical protein
MPQEPLERSEIEALAAARAELGREYEPALLDAFADKVEATIQQRVDSALASSRRGTGMERRMAGQQLALAIVSLVAAIPISIVAVVQGELLILLVCWIGIVAVNWAHAALGRKPWWQG